MSNTYRSQFRLPYSIYENLKKSADKNNRSVNAELVFILEAKLKLSVVQHDESIERLEHKLDLILRKLNASKD